MNEYAVKVSRTRRLKDKNDARKNTQEQLTSHSYITQSCLTHGTRTGEPLSCTILRTSPPVLRCTPA